MWQTPAVVTLQVFVVFWGWYPAQDHQPTLLTHA